MRTFSKEYFEYETAESKEPRFRLQVAWDDEDTIHTSFTSTEDTKTPTAESVIAGTFLNISGQTQRINPDIAASTIGGVSVSLIDLAAVGNILLYSEEFQQSSTWAHTGAGLTVTANTDVAPDGTTTADTLNDTSVSAAVGVKQSATITDDSETYSASINLKEGTASNTICGLELTGGTLAAAYNTVNWSSPPTLSGDSRGELHEIGGGFWRLMMAVDNNNSGNTSLDFSIFPEFISASTGTVVVWGAQAGRGLHTVRDAPYYQTTSEARGEVQLVTDEIGSRLKGGDGLRGKLARLYVGYEGQLADDYDLRLTYIIDNTTYKDGIYTLSLTDVQRKARAKIFDPDISNLLESISDTDTIIKINEVGSGRFQTVAHGPEWTSWISTSVGYVKIEDEVIVHSGSIFDTTIGWYLVVLERGALGTRAVAHDVDSTKAASKRRQVIEHIFIEGPAPKIIYALLTGILLNGSSPEDTLPSHWALGISSNNVRLADFTGIGIDLWDTVTEFGKFVRIENPGSEDGKRFIEKELLLWMGCFMPVYTTGELGLRRLSGVLADSSYNKILDESVIVSYGDLKHNMRSVINDIRVHWNWVDSIETFTKISLLVDSDSISAHGNADAYIIKFNAVHTGIHTDEDIVRYFDVLRDRYSGPPLELDLVVLPSNSMLEVGDTVRVVLEQIRDYNTSDSLDRTFEIQQIATNWVTGDLKLKLFASSQAAGALSPTTLNQIMDDSWYTSAGTSLDSSDSPAGPLTIVAGVVVSNGTINGHVSDMDSAIFYYDGDLTINAGVVVTITNNVQLRIKGALQINGTIDGLGNGPAGGAATTHFVGGFLEDEYSPYSVPVKTKLDLDIDRGTDGAFFMTSPAGAFDNIGVRVRAWYADPLTQKYQQWALPYPALINTDDTDLKGYPLDMRGNSGAGGMPMIRRTGVEVGIAQIKASSGAGGAGGAGLIIIARGMAFGASGEIDLSGADSTLGGSYVEGGKTFHAGAGAPGASGALLILMDGDYTPPELTDAHLSLNYGASPISATATIIGQALQNQLYQGGLWQVDNWPYSESVASGLPWAAYTGTLIKSAHRVVYIPESAVAVMDDSNFPFSVPGSFRDLLFWQRDAVPVANTNYGEQVDITDDGTRFIATNILAATTPTVQVVKSASNPIVEQNIINPATLSTAFTTTGWGEIAQLSNDGQRFMAPTDTSKPSTAELQGEVYIYVRTGVTWAVEQVLTVAPTVGNQQFGKYATGDKNLEKLMIWRNHTPNDEIQYWARSGATWTFQSVIPRPAGASTNYPISGYVTMKLSGDGEFLITGDPFRTVDGVANVGAVYLFQRSGANFNQLGDPLVPLAGLVYKWGDSLWGYDGIAINETGNSIAVSGQVYVDGAARIAIYHRAGSTVKLVQIIEDTAAGSLLRPIDLSDNGLILLTYDGANGNLRLYKRGSVEQEFTLAQTMSNTDDGAWGNSESMRLSSKGGFLIAGNTSTDVGATDAGSLHVHQFTTESQ